MHIQRSARREPTVESTRGAPGELSSRIRRLACGHRWAGVAALCGLLAACSSGHSPEREPLILISSFPDDAVVVCFLREDDATELGCTARPLPTTPNGVFEFRGRRFTLRTPSPTARVAVVGGIHPPELEPGLSLRVRAIATNDDGASEPSPEYFVLDARSSGVQRVVGDAIIAAELSTAR